MKAHKHNNYVRGCTITYQCIRKTLRGNLCIHQQEERHIYLIDAVSLIYNGWFGFHESETKLLVSVPLIKFNRKIGMTKTVLGFHRSRVSCVCDS